MWLLDIMTADSAPLPVRTPQTALSPTMIAMPTHAARGRPLSARKNSSQVLEPRCQVARPRVPVSVTAPKTRADETATVARTTQVSRRGNGNGAVFTMTIAP
ncbi:hypothetical protein GCM10025876_16740 [Demequina litorisediminis]|uniref:Uncharacterized protein n=1 Tax=Demequina litorisediminis TaxID=1849022 RepID=A0ABQ6ICF7_9MICO|nr:hypothetical protein GCM10025876_16740 [Demequina litorisediminis]